MIAASRPIGTLSRPFADFARRKVPGRIHEAVVRLSHQGRIVGHIARDFTAIEGREHFAETATLKSARKRKKASNNRFPSKSQSISASATDNAR